MIENAVFDKKMIEDAKATPEEMKEAMEEGTPFEYKEEAGCVRGYRYKGAIYITDVVS